MFYYKYTYCRQLGRQFLFTKLNLYLNEFIPNVYNIQVQTPALAALVAQSWDSCTGGLQFESQLQRGIFTKLSLNKVKNNLKFEKYGCAHQESDNTDNTYIYIYLLKN